MVKYNKLGLLHITQVHSTVTLLEPRDEAVEFLAVSAEPV